jgi:hypothetical protein
MDTFAKTANADYRKKQKFAVSVFRLQQTTEVAVLRIYVHTFTHAYKYIRPVTFTGEWSTNAERRIDLGGPVLRNVLDFYVPNSCLVSSERQLLICFPKAWNDLVPMEIKLIPEKIVFNQSMKKHLLNSLSANYTCTRLLCPHCHL